MKKLKLPTNVSRAFNRVGFKFKKHSPEILIVTGTIGVVASTVMACKATLKAHEVIVQAKEDLNDIKEASTNPEYKDRYSEEAAKKDTVIVYTQAGLNLAKIYGPAIAVGAVSIAGILTSHNIIRKRNIALAAAYATVDGSFKDYRKRLVDRFGEELDRELRYNIKTKEVETTVVDEKTGEEKVVTETVEVIDPNNRSIYTRCFDETCAGWTKDARYNFIFLKQQQTYANQLLQTQGYLYLNDVYKMLGMVPDKMGQIVGWIYDEKNPIGDNFVDFGIFDLHDKEKRMFVNGHEKSIWLDFNVDGNILDLMP